MENKTEDAARTLNSAMKLPGVRRAAAVGKKKGKRPITTAEVSRTRQPSPSIHIGPLCFLLCFSFAQRVSVYLELSQAFRALGQETEAAKVMQDAITEFQVLFLSPFFSTPPSAIDMGVCVCLFVCLFCFCLFVCLISGHVGGDASPHCQCRDGCCPWRCRRRADHAGCCLAQAELLRAGQGKNGQGFLNNKKKREKEKRVFSILRPSFLLLFLLFLFQRQLLLTVFLFCACRRSTWSTARTRSSMWRATGTWWTSSRRHMPVCCWAMPSCTFRSQTRPSRFQWCGVCA
jgi:hypothetical protein